MGARAGTSRLPGTVDQVGRDGTGSAPAGRVVIVSGSVGAGHDGVAHELAHRLRDRGHSVAVLDLLDGFPVAVRILLSSAYVLTVKIAPWLYELTCWLVERSRLFQRLTDRICGTAAGWLLTAVAGADVVVATYPPASRALGQLRRSRALTVPVVTYLTDPAPNFLWVHPDVDLHLCASRATAAETKATYGIQVEAAGPLVAAAFRATDRGAARAQLERSLGLGPDARIALVVLGSLGVGDVRGAVAALKAAGMLPIVLCGRNERLRRSLRGIPGSEALGWRDDVPVLVAGADLVVHNAGGLALTESLVAGVPAVTFASLPGHGRANARSLDRSGMAPWARTPAELTVFAKAITSATAQTWPAADETAALRISDLANASRRKPTQSAAARHLSCRSPPARGRTLSRRLALGVAHLRRAAPGKRPRPVRRSG